MLIIDDHPIVRQGLKQIIGQMNDAMLIDEASNGDEALLKIVNNNYDLIVLDLTMPGKNGIDVLKEVKSIKPELPAIVLTIHPEKQFAVRMLKAGAAAYLTKDRAPGELVDAINEVLQGNKYISSDLASRLVYFLENDSGKLPHENLSPREYQIMIMLAQGKSNKEIAQNLFLSIKTVITHRLNILMKMNMQNNIEITHYAILNGLIDL